MKRFLYRLNRRLISWIARPTRAGTYSPPDDQEVVYVLQNRSLTDLIILDLVAAADDFASPHAPLELDGFTEPKRFFSLFRAAGGRVTMQTLSQRMQRLVEAPEEVHEQICLVPVTVFWGRAMPGEGSWLRLLTSEHWAVTGRIKRLLNLILGRKDIWVHMGRPISLAEVAANDVERSVALRRTARLLRVRLRQQRINTLGPDFSHRRTLLNQVVTSRQVREAIEIEVAIGEKRSRLEKRAIKQARVIASDMSYPTIRFLSALLRWFWTRIYDGMDVAGLDKLETVGATHTLVYVPSHRSHLDYLVLSYLLFHRGFMIPHIAAGDNLNLPVLGGFLRRGGAFFIRRSFRDDPLYAAVFSEYLYQVYRRGHCVEFFPEGGRTRTGRLLPAKFGMLKTSLDHYERGLPRPLAFVPVYIGYEKLAEGASYLSELRGTDKKKESLGDLVRNLRLVRQDFGRVQVNIGDPLKLDEWLQDCSTLTADDRLPALSEEIMSRINRAATANPINLIAAVTLAAPKQSVERDVLIDQVSLYKQLLAQLYGPSVITQSTLSASAALDYVASLGMVARETESFGDVYYHDGFTSILMTWYLNNTIHLFALPSLIAALLVKRRRPLARTRLVRMAEVVYPYLASELSVCVGTKDVEKVIDTLQALQLISTSSENGLSAPQQGTPRQHQLSMLASLVMQTLERMFIVINLLQRSDHTIESLRTHAQLIAHKISRLYGINAPEFFDQRLFDQFIDGLRRRKVISVDADERITYQPVVTQVLRAAEFVIDPDIRYAVLSEAAPR